MRRYENNTLKLAEIAHDKGAKLILFTDQWRSPIHLLADIILSSRIIAPSAWDSAATPLFITRNYDFRGSKFDMGQNKESHGGT